MIAEILAVADIETAYKIMWEVSDSRKWLMFPLIALALTIAIPPALNLQGKVTEPMMKRLMIILAIGFFSYTGVIVYIYAGDWHYQEEVEIQLYKHFDGLNCEEKLMYLFEISENKPTYIYEKRYDKLLDTFFTQCYDDFS